jgi:5-methylcytosine-specific restriction endonuclease McrA
MTPENTKTNSKGWKLCKTCRAACQSRDYEKRKEVRKEYGRSWRKVPENKVLVSKYKRDMYQKIQKAIREAKLDKPCMDCGNIFPPCAMDFDHVHGKKKFNVGLAKNLRQLAEEIAKCELVCANCHRIRTFTRSGSLSASEK